jgi:hypothetical protein
LKLAFITSTKYLDEFASLGTMDMALAPLCFKPDRSDFNKKYCEYFRKRSKEGYFVLMDNGAYEKDLIPNELLLELADYIKPSCIVAPDLLGDSEETIKRTFDFLESDVFQKLPKEMGIMAVPQGQNLSEYLESYRLFAYEPRITFIGLNFVSNFDIPGKESSEFKDFQQMNNRLAMTKYLEDNNLVNKEKSHHLLGLASPLELSHHKYREWVYSNDSSCPFIHGALGVKVDPEQGLIDTCSNKTVHKSIVDIKDFEYGHVEDLISKKRPNKALAIHESYKGLIVENCNTLFSMIDIGK